MNAMISLLLTAALLAQALPAYSQATDDPDRSARSTQAIPLALPQIKPSAPAQMPRSEPAAVALDIMLVLDNSGSMKKNDPRFLTRSVVESFLERLDVDDRIGMVVFDQAAQLASPLMSVQDPAAKAEFLTRLNLVNYKGRFTDSPAGIERALYEFRTQAREGAKKVIIFLTDGIVATGNKARDVEKERWLQEVLAAQSQQAGIRIFSIAFTDQADMQLVQNLALKTDGEYFRAYQAEDIQGVFNTLYGRLITPITSASSEPPTVQAPAPASTPPQSPPGSRLLLPVGGAVMLGGLAFFLIRVLRRRFLIKVLRKRFLTGSVLQTPRLIAAYLANPVSYTLDKKSIRIGRTADNDIVIPESSVSALHAIIECRDDFFYLEDQRSRNGTWLNDEQLKSCRPVRLKSGDRIRFDIYEFQFDRPDQVPMGMTIIPSINAIPRPSGTDFKPQTSASPINLSQSAAARTAAPPVQPDTAKAVPSEGATPEVMCPLHPALEATERCSACQQAFCLLCVTKKGDQMLCPECLRKLKQPEQLRA